MGRTDMEYRMWERGNLYMPYFLLYIINKLEEEMVAKPYIKLKGNILSNSTLETQNTFHILSLLND